ncbi:hypothetical protein O181_090902 [Austropuccinia psidii MF-1]|uniref:Uncharacterized protein n=1 Tax=Austropuccinia psidii MF-1 TaxID=1389203 RepID=A0A9Q3IW90_9BASI|nr:hypothetical protein [Austropuccinia psidii MF-1]
MAIQDLPSLGQTRDSSHHLALNSDFQLLYLIFHPLNTNESMHESPTFRSSPQQILYANECHHQQHHQYQTPGDYGLYSQTHIGQDMSLFASNQDGQDNSTISDVNEDLAFGNVAQTQSVTITGGSQEINSLIATHTLPQEESTSPKLPSASAKRIRQTTKQLADEAKSGLKKKSGEANKNKKEAKDQNPGFVWLDFENICSYLGDWDHDNEIVSRLLGGGEHTRAQAFKWFAQYLNDHNVLGTLNLSGHNSEQRWRTYKRKFVNASWLLLRTGSGLMELTNITLQEEVSLQKKKDNSNLNSSNCESFSNSGNSSSEEGRSVNSLVTINPGENQLHSGNSDS